MIRHCLSAGNDGWNSETGEHKTFSKGSNGRNWTDYRFDEFKYRRTVPRQINLPDGSGRFVDVPANIPALESSYFLTNRKLRGSWLAVVNVNRQNIIHWSSNGCATDRKHYCLAAPTDIKSTFAAVKSRTTVMKPIRIRIQCGLRQATAAAPIPARRWQRQWCPARWRS